jgi:hypothetical protein
MKYLLALLLSVPCFGISDKYSIKTQADASISTSALQLPFRASRSYLLVQNKGTDSVIVKFGSVHSASEGILILPGGNYEPAKVPVDSMYLKASSGTQVVAIIEGLE